jgi:hypothetical protein
MKKEVNFSYKKAIYPHLQRQYQDETWWVSTVSTRKNAQKETASKPTRSSVSHYIPRMVSSTHVRF